MLLEHLRKGLRTPDEINAWLSLPCLGTLPEYGSHGHESYAAALRSVQMRLIRDDDRGQGQVLSIVSALPGEGKTTLVCNLALALASNGYRTLLIDCDTYTGAASNQFQLQGPGLRDVSQEPLVLDRIVNIGRSGLHMIGAGRAPEGHTAAQRPNKALVSAILSQARHRYDVILLDTPPLLSTGDTSLLEVADRAVLLVAWNKTDRDAVTEATNLLGNQADRIIGALLSRVSAKWYRLSGRNHHLANRSYPMIQKRPFVAAPRSSFSDSALH
jgi:Mrp family chromosome partitioning ATPase